MAYLAHESCTVNGETFISGMGMVARLTFVAAPGYLTETMTPEAIAENIDTVMDLTDRGGAERGTDSARRLTGLTPSSSRSRASTPPARGHRSG